MSLAEENGPERGGDEMVAAEYVVGVLPADERRAASERIEREPEFARLVDRWEVHLAPVAVAYQPVEPPEGLKPAIDRRIFSNPAPAAGRPGILSSLAVWRGLTFAALAALAIFVAIPYFAPTPISDEERYVASLAAEGTDVHYFVVYDAATHEVGLSHVTGARADGRDFELWLIEGSNLPKSLGVIPVGSNVHIVVGPDLRDKIASGAVLAISLEPAGGSTTGQPTGPVVAAGDLKTI